MKLRKYQMGGLAPEAAPAEGAPVEGGVPAQGGAEEQSEGEGQDGQAQTDG